MTRLFLRFYLGVIAILFTAWSIQAYYWFDPNDKDIARVVENALSGGARLAVARLSEVPANEFDAEFSAVSKSFRHPVNVAEIDVFSNEEGIENRLTAGDVVYYPGHVAVAFPDSERVLQLGPLPSFAAPSRARFIVSLSLVFAFAALAIAVLLRPVIVQLRAIERTATAIAKGDLSARLTLAQATISLPIADAFNSMADKTESTLNAQRELLQSVSHELRTPLARIRFAADLVESASDDTQRAARLDSVDRATQDLDDLVGELLSYARLDAETNPKHVEPFDLAALVSDLVSVRRPLFQGVEFVVECRPAQIVVNQRQSDVAKAIGNLINNAGRFAKTIVCVTAELANGGCVVTVEDDGPGIPAGDKNKIFKPFARLQNNGSGNPGTGLGLAITDRFVTRAGGSVIATDAKNGGTRMTIRLPLGDSTDY